MIQAADFWRLLKQSGNGWLDDRAASMGAALAYYTAFSLTPVLILVVSIAGLFFGRDAAQGALFEQISGIIGNQATDAVHTMLINAHQSGTDVIGTLIGIGALLLGATTVFVELQSDLDRIWKVERRVGNSAREFIRKRLLSFGLILAIGFLLIVSLVVTSIVAAISTFWGEAFKGMEMVLQALNFLVSFGIITMLFGMIYKLLPDVKVAWSDVWIGAAFTSLLFAIGKFLIGLYIGKSAVSSSFGAAGAFAVLLIWIYYSTQIFLLGAEFTYHYSLAHGSLARRRNTQPPKV